MPACRVGDIDIWYETAGDGPAMVFVHANPFDHDLWLYQAAHFSTWFKVVSIDIRGYGRSTKVTTPYSLKDMCDDVVGVMSHLGIDRAVLCGCSVGSGISLLLGLDRPDLFSAVVLVGGNSGSSPRYKGRIEGYRSDLAAYHPKHIRELVRPEFADSRLGGHLLGMFLERGPRLKGEAIAQVFMAGNHTDSTPRLSSMQPLTLVINGEFDTSRTAGELTARSIPGAVHRVLQGTGHACCIEDPAGFNALVIDFLKKRGLMPSL